MSKALHPWMGTIKLLKKLKICYSKWFGSIILGNDMILFLKVDQIIWQCHLRGGDLADSLSSTIVSERELNTIAYKNGIKVMEVRRNLSNSYNQMTISQTVFVSEKDKPTNWSSYSKVIIH